MNKLVEPYSTLTSLHEGFGYYRDLSKSVLQTKNFPKLNVPVIVIVGSKVVGNGLANLMKEKYMQNKELLKPILLKGCGHWLIEECKTKFLIV